uniref:Uncharacterized protein n=1 Tax=Cacopsylla melanoneura TaxID=428564 RepID=A0A8D8XKQ1_9HEMI
MFLAEVNQPMVHIQSCPIREVLLSPCVRVKNGDVGYSDTFRVEFLFDGGINLGGDGNRGRDQVIPTRLPLVVRDNILQVEVQEDPILGVFLHKVGHFPFDELFADDVTELIER